jgi:phage terminase small subunit
VKKLTPKQSLFVQEYLIDLNATQAAIRAGYSEKTAHSQGPRLLENVGIAQALAEASQERSDKTKIDAAWVLKKAEEVFDKCMQAVEVTDHEGNGIGEYKFEANAANRALEIIGKHVDVQAFLERKQLEVVDRSDVLSRARQRAKEQAVVH